MKRAKSDKSKLKARVWTVFSLYIRRRDCILATGSLEYGECISCDYSGHISSLDAGHYIPKHNANYFSERGVHTQCKRCNGFLQGNQVEYLKGLIKLYGEGIDEVLKEEARQYKKFTMLDLRKLLEYYKTKLEEIE